MYQHNASLNSIDVSRPNHNISNYSYVLWELLLRNPEILNSIFGSQDRLTCVSWYCQAIRTLKGATTSSFPRLTNLELPIIPSLDDA
jgi:hypothetical protein